MKSASRKIFWMAAIASFAALAVFGGLNAAAMETSDASGCIATALNGFSCPAVPGSLDYINFHVKAFTGFASSALGSALILMTLIALAFSLKWTDALLVPAPILTLSYSSVAHRDAYVPLSRAVSMNWLSRLFNSPSRR